MSAADQSSSPIERGSATAPPSHDDRGLPPLPHGPALWELTRNELLAVLVLAVVVTVIAILSALPDTPEAAKIDGAPEAPVRLRINLVDRALLTVIPGIGDSLAQRIVTERDANGPFADMEDLLKRVKGLQRARMERFAPNIDWSVEEASQNKIGSN